VQQLGTQQREKSNLRSLSSRHQLVDVVSISSSTSSPSATSRPQAATAPLAAIGLVRTAAVAGAASSVTTTAASSPPPPPCRPTGRRHARQKRRACCRWPPPSLGGHRDIGAGWLRADGGCGGCRLVRRHHRRRVATASAASEDCTWADAAEAISLFPSDASDVLVPPLHQRRSAPRGRRRWRVPPGPSPR